jgi:hypothetical protein
LGGTVRIEWGRTSRSAWEGRAAAGAVAVEVSVGYMSVEVSVDICPLDGRVGARVGGARWVRGRVEGEGNGRRGRGVGWEWAALGFGDYLDAGLPVAKSAPNPYTTHKTKTETTSFRRCALVLAEPDVHYDFLHKTGLKSYFGPVEPEQGATKSNWADDRPLAHGVEFLRLEHGLGHFSPRTN